MTFNPTQASDSPIRFVIGWIAISSK
jgi:hypothetical protein